MPVRSRGGDKLAQRLGEIAANVSKAQEVNVGFLEGATYPDGTPVALVAVINEYGKPPSQPPRPFFRQAITKHSPEWGSQAAKILKSSGYDARATLSDMGEIIQSEIQDSITTFTSPPLKPSTIAAKGFSKPLVDTGTMLMSVSYVVKDKSST